jgi:hypothetical protein
MFYKSSIFTVLTAYTDQRHLILRPIHLRRFWLEGQHQLSACNWGHWYCHVLSYNSSRALCGPIRTKDYPHHWRHWHGEWELDRWFFLDLG